MPSVAHQSIGPSTHQSCALPIHKHSNFCPSLSPVLRISASSSCRLTRGIALTVRCSGQVPSHHLLASTLVPSRHHTVRCIFSLHPPPTQSILSKTNTTEARFTLHTTPRLHAPRLSPPFLPLLLPRSFLSSLSLSQPKKRLPPILVWLLVYLSVVPSRSYIIRTAY